MNHSFINHIKNFKVDIMCNLLNTHSPLKGYGHDFSQKFLFYKLQCLNNAFIMIKPAIIYGILKPKISINNFIKINGKLNNNKDLKMLIPNPFHLVC